YGFLLTTFRGSPPPVHGLRHRTTPCSSRLMIFSVTIAYTSIAVISKIRLFGLKERAAFAALSLVMRLRRGYRRTLAPLLRGFPSCDFRASAFATLRSRYESGRRSRPSPRTGGSLAFLRRRLGVP